MLAVTPALGCASATGWTRERSRSCERDGPPRVCVVVEPDRQLVFEVGDIELVPQECAEGPEGRRGGSLRITARDGATGDEARRRVHVRRGRELTLTAEAPLKLRVVERARCEHP
ncbi:MAG: hypothetical protein H6713_21860 [Myxococcales bacterium]|nr:hypothetical protein [Myxococcales bacterium]MCB9752609.1 hypothetical protein [Myxococcales bacterium]